VVVVVVAAAGVLPEPSGLGQALGYELPLKSSEGSQAGLTPSA
jgi:hypothetical protein